MRDVPGQVREHLGGDRAVEAFDLAPPLRDPDAGVDEPDVGVQADPVQPGAGEVGPVVAVEHLGQPLDRPPRVGLGSHGLVQGQGGLLGIRGAGEDGVAGDRAGVVVEDHAQPRPHRAPPVVEDRHVEQGVVGLPLLIGPHRRPAVHQLVSVPVGGVSLQGQGAQPGVDRGDHAAHARVARGCPAALRGQIAHPAVDEPGRRRRAAQRQGLDHRDQLRRQPALAAVAAGLALQAGRGGVRPVFGGPALQGADRDLGVGGEPGQRHPLVEVLAQQCRSLLRTQLHHHHHPTWVSPPDRARARRR